jgi:tetratricopeptide (TPR) repeat protein
MEGLAENDDSSRWRFRLVVIGVVILAIALLAAIVFGSIRAVFAPVLARYYYSLGHTSVMKHDFDRAIAHFSDAIRLDPKYDDAYFSRAYSENEKKQFDPAIADYTMAIQITPKYAGSYINRGNIYVEKHDFDRAIADYDMAIRLNPNSADAYCGRGGVHLQKNELDQAISDYNRCIQLNPGYASAFFGRGCAWDQKNDRAKANADHSEAIRLQPEFPVAYIHRGNAYLKNREYPKAIADFSEAIRLEPANAYAHNSIAWTWTFSSDPAFRDVKRAVDSATLACELSEWKHPRFLETLAGACAQSGDLAAAAKWQTKANELYDNPEDRKSGEQWLTNYKAGHVAVESRE